MVDQGFLGLNPEFREAPLVRLPERGFPNVLKVFEGLGLKKLTLNGLPDHQRWARWVKGVIKRPKIVVIQDIQDVDKPLEICWVEGESYMRRQGKLVDKITKRFFNARAACATYSAD